MHLILLSTDLMTQSKVFGAVGSLGLKCVMTPSLKRLLEAAVEQAIVVLDLATQGYEPVEAVAQLKGLPNPPIAILAFGPHVHEARLQSAIDAGCNAVFARGQFFGQTAEILRQYLVENPQSETISTHE